MGETLGVIQAKKYAIFPRVTFGANVKGCVKVVSTGGKMCRCRGVREKGRRRISDQKVDVWGVEKIWKKEKCRPQAGHLLLLFLILKTGPLHISNHIRTCGLNKVNLICDRAAVINTSCRLGLSMRGAVGFRGFCRCSWCFVFSFKTLELFLGFCDVLFHVSYLHHN